MGLIRGKLSKAETDVRDQEIQVRGEDRGWRRMGLSPFAFPPRAHVVGVVGVLYVVCCMLYAVGVCNVESRILTIRIEFLVPDLLPPPHLLSPLLSLSLSLSLSHTCTYTYTHTHAARGAAQTPWRANGGELSKQHVCV